MPPPRVANEVTLRSNSEAVAPSKRGFNLIEAAIVLGVVGLVIGGIWVAATRVSESRKDNRSIEQILQVVENIHTLYGAHIPSGYTPFGPELLATLAPPDMLLNGATQTPHGYSNSFYLNSDSSGSWILFSIYTGTSVADCTRLGTKIASALKGYNATVQTYEGLLLGDIGTSQASCQQTYDWDGDTSIDFWFSY